jgi:hypothetical protein
MFVQSLYASLPPSTTLLPSPSCCTAASSGSSYHSQSPPSIPSSSFPATILHLVHCLYRPPSSFTPSSHSCRRHNPCGLRLCLPRSHRTQSIERAVHAFTTVLKPVPRRRQPPLPCPHRRLQPALLPSKPNPSAARI